MICDYQQLDTQALRIVAFDLDDTLAPSKSPLEAPMAAALRQLLEKYEVCVISGGQLAQFETQLLTSLQASAEQLSRLHLMPTCGTQYYRFAEGQMQTIFKHELSAAEREKALRLLEEKARELGLWVEESYGPILEDRGSQITYSALGQEAPLEAKRAWDPQGTKKNTLRDAIAPLLPELEVRSGGSTSIDITRKGIDKAYGIAQLRQATGAQASEILFIGDRLDPAGNDYPVVATGVPCVAVSGPAQTLEVINHLVAGA